MSDNIRLKFYSSIVHPFISVFVPFMFISTVVLTVVNGAIALSGTRVFPPMFYALLLLVGVSETVTGNLLYKERIAGMLPRLREFVFVIAFGLLFILLLNGDLFRGDIKIGRIRVWLPLIFVGIQWLLSYFIHQRLRNREIFLRFFEGKNEKESKQVYQEFMHEGSESLTGVRSIRKLIITLTTLGFAALVILGWGFKIEYDAADLFLVLCFFVINMLLLASLNTMNEAQFIMMDGHIVPTKQRRFRLGLIVLIFAAVGLIMIPVTGEEQIVPSSVLTAFFEWLQSIGQFDRGDVEVEAPEFQGVQQDMQLPDMERVTGGEARDQLDLTGLTRIIGWTILVALAALVVGFLFAPLLRGKRGGTMNPLVRIRALLQTISTAITKALDSLKEALEARRLRQRVKLWKKVSDRGKRGAGRGEEAAGTTPTRLGRKERRIHNRVLKSFFRFTKWGEKKGVPFRTTMGAWEYALKLESVVPALKDDCVDIAGMFGEVMYSNHIIDEQFRTNYLDKIKQVVRD